MKREDEVQADIQKAAVADGCVLMRNNSGALKAQDGRMVRFGLGNVSKAHNERIKSSDLIGPTVITITPEMVGRKLAVLTACEVKEEGWVFNPKDKREVAQKAFIDWVKALGGFAGFAASVEQFRREVLGRK